MQRAVLLNQSTAIYPDNFITGKSLPQHFPRAGIILRLAIGGVKHCIIQNQEISVSGRKPFPFLFYLIGHGQSQQTVRFPLQRTEGLQLLLHAMQFFVMLIIRILALYIGYRVGRAETGQRVYMTVRIVTCQITVVQPKNTLQVKNGTKIFLNFHPVHLSVPVRRKQAFGGGEQRTHAVTFDGTAFKDKPQAIYILSFHHFRLHRTTRNQIILIGCKLQSPPVELKVEQRYTVSIQ